MATKKKLLQAAAGTAAAAGGAALNVEDVFSTYLYEGNGSSQVIENGINLGQSGDGGSGYFNGVDAYLEADDALDFHTSSSSDITIEMFLNIDDGWTGVRCPFGINATDGSTNYLNLEVDPPSSGTGTFGLFSNNPSLNVTIGSYSVNTWHHIAITYDGTSLKLYKDGTLVTTQTWTADAGLSTRALNIGMETDSGNTAGNFYKGYMSNFRISNSVRYTANFTAPSSPLSADGNTELLTLQGDSPFVDNSTNSVAVTNTNTQSKSFGPFDAADSGEGGLVWIKNRDTSGWQNMLYDTERGAGKDIRSDSTAAENVASPSEFPSFNANGFTVQTNGTQQYVNYNNKDYASWTFRKAPKFFDVVTYTGDGTAGRSISHNLDSSVGAVIIKNLTGQDWSVWHRSISANTFLKLNATAAEISGSNDVQSASTTTFTVGNDARVNQSGVSYVAYLFAHNDGDGEFGPDGDADIIKCGSYTGNGTDQFIDLGFEPQWVMIKDASTGGTYHDWYIFDSMRKLDVSGSGNASLMANLSDAEGGAYASSSYNLVQPTPTGMIVEGTSGPLAVGTNGDTYIYIAIRRGPMAVPEDATDVFDVQTYTEILTSGTNITSGFVTDAVLQTRNSAALGSYITPRLTNGYIPTHDIDAETANDLFWDRQDGVGIDAYFNNTGNETDVVHMWKRAPNFFDVVAYTGNGAAGRTISHNLGVAPEMMWVKKRSGVESWAVYHSLNGGTHFGRLQTSNAYVANSNVWDDTDTTASVFTVDTDTEINQSGEDYIAYLWASLDGVSKVGSYTGNGSTQTIDCGFSSGARFVLIKRAYANGNWYVWDSERGIVSGNDPYLELNTTDTEDNTTDSIDPASSGFAVNQVGATAINVSATTYLFYAIA